MQCIFSHGPASTEALLHGTAGGVGYFDERFIEYDLDVEDVKWLEAFNRGQQRLPQRRFELLLWRLEVANAEATDAALAAAGEPSTLECLHVPVPWAILHSAENC